MVFSKKLAVWFVLQIKSIWHLTSLCFPEFCISPRNKLWLQQYFLFLALSICHLVSFQWASCMPNIWWSLFLWVYLLQHIRLIHYKRSTRIKWLLNHPFCLPSTRFHLAGIFSSTFFWINTFCWWTLFSSPKSLLV